MGEGARQLLRHVEILDPGGACRGSGRAAGNRLAGGAPGAQPLPGSGGDFHPAPSLEELGRRLRGRGTDSDEVIARRLAAAQAEMRHVGEFDYAIINKELQRASEELLLIVRASRLRYAVQGERHATLIEHLLQ